MSRRPLYAYQRGLPGFRAGLLAAVVIAIATYFAFAKDIPFTHGYRIQAVVKNSNLLGQRAPVRIAGIQAGKVIKVARYKRTGYSVITMEIDKGGRPIKQDATLKIRPRLFLEGNFFVDLKPGTPSGKELADGGMIPVTQTATPVQLDQVLTGLQSGTRRNLQQTVDGLGQALNEKPTAADDLDQDPDVRGASGGEALNRSFTNSPYALRDGSIALDALRGNHAHDLSRTIRGLAKATGGLARNEGQLAGLITDFNTTMQATASRAPDLQRAVTLLGPTAANARRGFASVSRAIEPTRRFARDIVPGVRQTPATIEAADPWLAQARPLLGTSELGGLLDQLTPASAQLGGLTSRTRRWLPRLDQFSQCVNDVLLPLVNTPIKDGATSSGEASYKELWYAMTGQAGEGQGFDGNGPFLRIGAAGGSYQVTSGSTNYSREPGFAAATLPPQYTSPAFPNKVPPLRRDKACHTQPVPDVNGPSARGPADGSRPRSAAPASPKREPVIAGRYDDVKVSAAARRVVPMLAGEGTR